MLNPAVSLVEETFNKVPDMNLFIYVLLLSIWTNSCLDRQKNNGSDTAGMYLTLNARNYDLLI